MSAFGIGINTQGTHAGEVKGNITKIACESWFTSEGDVTPRLVKFIDENGKVKSVNHENILVNYKEQKNYSGIPSIEFDCALIIDETIIKVKLIFNKDTCKWIMTYL